MSPHAAMMQTDTKSATFNGAVLAARLVDRGRDDHAECDGDRSHEDGSGAVPLLADLVPQLARREQVENEECDDEECHAKEGEHRCALHILPQDVHERLLICRAWCGLGCNRVNGTRRDLREPIADWCGRSSWR